MTRTAAIKQIVTLLFRISITPQKIVNVFRHTKKGAAISLKKFPQSLSGCLACCSAPDSFANSAFFNSVPIAKKPLVR